MAAPCKMLSAVHMRLLATYQHRHNNFQVTRTAYFWQKDKEDKTEKVEEIESSTLKVISNLKPSRMQTSSRLVKSYTPPDNIEEKVREIVQEVCGNVPKDLSSVQLDNRKVKFKILTRIMAVLDHSVTNRELGNMNNVQDVLNYFKTEIKDTSILEDLSKVNLPSNIHINLNSVKFDPENDNFFGGLSAFPDRPTITSSLRRKHRSNKT